MTKQIRLGAFVPGGGQHVAAWRHPDSPADGHMSVEVYKQLIQTAEAGLFDAFFMADGLAVGFGGARHASNAKVAGFEPLTLFAALAGVTRHIGLIATASTTYEQPYGLARKFASLDLISQGRAAWNVVTTTGDATARNFGLEVQRPHAERYAIASEHVAVVKRLWESFEDDAFVFDKASGQFFDPEKLHDTDHEGQYFKVAGPLNISRSPQGHPVIVQAGQSSDGRDLAAATAEVIFTAHQTIEDARVFYSDVKTRAQKLGRDPAHVLIMPGLAPYVAPTRAEAQAKLDALNSLIDDEQILQLLGGFAGDTEGRLIFDLDGPLPPKPDTEGHKSRVDMLWTIAEKHNFTLRQLAHWIATARGHLTVVGTPSDIADVIEDWVATGAADGFNIMPPSVPAGLDDFVTLVVPELQRRGLFRTAYEGKTLRENLGLPFPSHPQSRPLSVAAE